MYSYSMILVERYSDHHNAEIRLDLPQGESFIIASKVGEDRYEVCVILPWYGEKFFTGIGDTVMWDAVSSECWQGIMDAPTSDLISIIRDALPIIKELNREANLDI